MSITIAASLHSSTSKELPTGWRWAKLGEFMPPTVGSLDLAQFPTEAFDLYSIPAFDQGVPEVVHGKNVGSTKQVVVSGDVLLSKIVPHIRRTWVVGNNTGRRKIASTEWIVFRTSDVDSEYLKYALVDDSFHKEYMRTTSGVGGSLVRARPALVSQLFIPLPPLQEQCHIASILREQMAAVETARIAAQARLEAVASLPAALYRHFFGDIPAFAASPVLPIKANLPGWQWHRLTDLARLATGHTPSRYHSEYWNGEIPWLQLADIRSLDSHEVQDTSEHINELGIQNSSAVLLPKGTVCMSRTASVGFFTIMGRSMATSQDFVNWICSENIDPWFLMYLLIANRERIRDLGSGAVHKTIYFPTVQSFNVCIPSISEQRRLAHEIREYLSLTEYIALTARTEREAINTLPAALLRRAFNGEI